MANLLKEKLCKGQSAIGFWLFFPSPDVVELLSSFGMDWLLIDTEHGSANYERVEDMLRAMKGAGPTPLVRVAANDQALIKKALDRGADGVLVPLVNSAAEAAAAVAAAQYPPDGVRGVAGTRVNRYGLDFFPYYERWNRDVLVAIQIETRQALDQVEEIAAVPGVDVLFVGPHDLSASLGVYRQFDHPEYLAATKRILDAARSNHVAAGFYTGSVAEALVKVDEGFQFVAAGADAQLLASAAQEAMDRINARLTKR